jgi:hypothetical protein
VSHLRLSPTLLVPGDSALLSCIQPIAHFSLERINRRPADFDHHRLGSLNLQHMSNGSRSQPAVLIAPFLIERDIVSR